MESEIETFWGKINIKKFITYELDNEIIDLYLWLHLVTAWQHQEYKILSSLNNENKLLYKSLKMKDNKNKL